MGTYLRIVGLLCQACGLVAGVLVILSIAVITQMVVLRYGFGEATIWQTEFVIYSLVATTLVGSPYVLHTRGHVNMDIVVLWAGPRLRFVMAVAADLISFGFCAAMFIYGASFWFEAWDRDWHSDTLWRVPLWIPYLALPVGMGVMSLRIVGDFMQLLTGRLPPFGLPPRDAVGPDVALHPHGEAAEREREAVL